MANLPEEKKWREVYQWETSDRALGGPDSIFTQPIRNLTDRTAYLKEQLEAAQDSLTQHESSTNHPAATITQPGFVQLSSALDSDSESHAATVKAVKAVYQLAQSKADGEHSHPFTVFSVNGKTGDVQLNADDVAALPATQLANLVTANRRLKTDNLDTLTDNTAIYAYDSGVTSAPNDKAGYLLQLNPGTERGISQLWVQAYTDDIYIRAKDIVDNKFRPWKRLLINDDLPAGIPQPWPAETPPTGWLKCNGAIFDKTRYPQLALAYPEGKLPDLRGEFIRGWDDGRGVDGERTVGSWQKGSVAIFDPTVSTPSIGTLLNSSDELSSMKQLVGYDAINIGDYRGVYQTASTAPMVFPITEKGWQAGATRPRNISFLYIVRAA